MPDKQCLMGQWLYAQSNALLSRIVTYFKGTAFTQHHADLDKFKKKTSKHYRTALEASLHTQYKLTLNEDGYPTNTLKNRKADVAAADTYSELQGPEIAQLFNIFIHRAPRCPSKSVVLFRGQKTMEPWTDGKHVRVNRRILSTSAYAFFAKRFARGYIFVYHLLPNVPFVFISTFEWEFLIPLGVEMKLIESYVDSEKVTVVHVQVGPLVTDI